MNRKKMKRLDKKIKYAVYSNYDFPISINEDGITLKPIPSYISYCKADLEELNTKLYVIKKDMRKVSFKMKHSSTFDFVNWANTYAILWGMKLATEDYIKTRFSKGDFTRGWISE